MYGLYQSQIWRKLQAEIYQKPHGFIDLFGKEYFYLIKEKKIWPFRLREMQIMGIEVPDDRELVRAELAKVKQFFKAQSRWNIFFQFGIVNEITSFDNARARERNIVEKVKNMRLNARHLVQEQTWMQLSFKENMPQSTIMINLDKTDEELLKEMNSGCAERVKKAIRKGAKVRLWTPEDYDIFFKKWQGTATGKGFHTITRKQFDRLISTIIEQKCGNMFISELDGEPIAGNICLFYGNTIVYLYGFTDRKYTNMWGHHYLKYGMFERARDHGFDYCDLMGGAPTGFPEHPLSWVSKFKESLGGMKWEFYGNYDLVLNPLLYWLFKLLVKVKWWFKK